MANSPKGLATVAFLKTKLDEGCDHLGLFEPLILDSLLHIGTPDFLADDIKALIHQRTGISVPANAVQTLLGRCTKRGLLQRTGGRFFRTSKSIPDSKLDEARAVIQTEQATLGQAFITFAADQGLQIANVSEALDYVATFISDNKVNVILNDPIPDSPLERSTLNRKLTRTIARFIAEHCLPSPEMRSALAGLTEGILLQDTLLMRDIPEAAQRFQDLIVTFDTGVLFAAIDLTGVANAVAAKEGLTLLRQAGARTIAFNRTLQEMRQILAIYEDRVRTTTGRLSLYPTALTHHILTERLSAADIRLISSTLENRLANIGISIRDIPAHEPRYTLNEKTLAEALTNVDRSDSDSPRIRHDVDCVAGILTLRKGRSSISIERSGAIFCTISGRVVRNVQKWYFDEGEKGVPPIIHLAALTSIAWLKKPAAAPNLKMHELAAICVAAMRPTRATMTKLVDNLRRLKSEGAITDDETAAIVASELMEPLLARLDDDFEPDSDSIQEAIERVRDGYRREATAAAEQAVKAAEQEMNKTQAEAAQTQQAAEEAVRIARAEATLAQQTAAAAISAQEGLVISIEGRIEKWSGRLSSMIFWACVCILALAAILSLPGIFDAVGGTPKWIARVILAIAALLGLISAIHGTSLKDLKTSLQDKIAKWIKTSWLPTLGTGEKLGKQDLVGSGPEQLNSGDAQYDHHDVE